MFSKNYIVLLSSHTTPMLFFCHFTTVNSRSNLAWLHLKRAQSQAGLVAALHGMMTLEYPVTLLLRNPFSPITPRPHR